MRGVILAVVAILAGAGPVGAALKVEEVPLFQWRARALSVAGETAGKKLTFRLGTGQAAADVGQWSDWVKFDTAQAQAALRAYPNHYLGRFPVVTHLSVGGAADPTPVEAELRLEESGETVKLEGELFGPSLGVLLWRDEKKAPHADTMAAYNRRYWQALAGVQVPAAQRPKHFPIVDRFIGGDDDRRAWREGIDELSKAGFSAIMLPPSKPIRDLLLQVGLRRTAWAVYSPPGYAFDYDAKVTPEAIEKWAQDQAKPYRDAGYAPEDMAAFAMSDEPGWYYPSMFKALEGSPTGLARFRDYLKAQRLTPKDVGADTWDNVLPIGRSQAKDLPSRRLFYWTARFFSWDSARHFSVCTRALEKAFRPGLPIFTNWNFFSGRFFVPGPVANNPDKQNPDAAMGGQDWLEFGRMRGGTLLWTEDWFPDTMAYQWSFYCAKLRSAAQKGGVEYGGYVIPRTAGDREDGILQKILCVIGSGGKALKYFVFGPEYNFPGNCYSERARVLPKMAEAHKMIGAAEDLLWPGKQPRPQVAILAPRSAEPWDAKEIPIPNQIQDATNLHLMWSTVDYMAEVFGLYDALQHANVPADFVDEDDLTPAGLKPYRVLYVTEPNIPAEGQRGIVQWVRAGGTLAMVTGAGSRDRYDDACRILADGVGVAEKPRERLLVSRIGALPKVGTGRGELGEFTAFGARGTYTGAQKGVVATFEDGAPAVIWHAVGAGQVVAYAWLPGIAYRNSPKERPDGILVDFSPSVRAWILYPSVQAKVTPPAVVDRPMIETPVLLSPAGAAVTLLNWSGESVQRLRLTLRLPFKPAKVASVRQGPLEFEQTPAGIECTLPLGAADIVTVRP